MNKNNYLPWVTAAGLVASLVIALPVLALAQTSVGANVGVGVGANASQGGFHNGANGGMRRGGMMPGVFGTVTAINGTILTVTSQGRMWAHATSTSASAPAATVYTVDASNATIYKGTATTTVSFSSIATGDTVMVQGTVSGTNIAATKIFDGIGMGMRGPGMGSQGFGPGHGPTSTPPVSPIKGNGEPVVGGAVTAVNGTMLTIMNASNVTYTVDASNATIVKNGTTTTVSGIATGDTLVVQGTVDGTSVTASSVLDQGAKASATSTGPQSRGGGFGGIFSAISGFFQHLFGF